MALALDERETEESRHETLDQILLCRAALPSKSHTDTHKDLKTREPIVLPNYMIIMQIKQLFLKRGILRRKMSNACENYDVMFLNVSLHTDFVC